MDYVLAILKRTTTVWFVGTFILGIITWLVYWGIMINNTIRWGFDAEGLWGIVIIPILYYIIRLPAYLIRLIIISPMENVKRQQEIQTVNVKQARLEKAKQDWVEIYGYPYDSRCDDQQVFMDIYKTV
jgi:hypothetical protein